MAGNSQLHRWFKSIQTRSTLAVLITAAILIEGTAAVQYWFAREGLRNEVTHRAEGELRVKTLEIEKRRATVEAAANSTVWVLERAIAKGLPMDTTLCQMLEHNPDIIGCGVGFKADYYPWHGRWYEVYATRQMDGSCDVRLIGSQEHDYLSAEWFTVPFNSGKNDWTEPYFDDAGGKTMLITYSQPVHDAQGRTVAVFGVDVSLDWNVSLNVAGDDGGKASHINIYLLALMLIGLALLSYIMFRSINSMNRLQAVNSEKERIESELNIAKRIQEAMLPKIFPPYPERSDIDIYASLAPAREVGGDFYDFLIRDDKLFFCIGDVSGKGIPAALVMAVTRTLFRNVTSQESMPQSILTIMNDTLADNNESNMFVTMFVGVLDLKTGKLLYSNAGHDAPLLVATATESLPCDPNLPIGIMEHWKYTLQEAVIAPETIIFLYTDGLTEAENATHEQFGMERIMQVTTHDHQTKPLIVNMTDAVQQFVAEAEQSDDLTMMAIQYEGEKPDVTLQRSITLANDVKDVPQMNDFIADIAKTLQMTKSDTMQVNLALEEVVVNVMNYAYPEGTNGDVNIAATADEHQLTLTITDSGTPFDPTQQSEVDITQPLDERPIGGLGIHLFRNIMDDVSYQRVDDTNRLTITKRYSQL